MKKKYPIIILYILLITMIICGGIFAYLQYSENTKLRYFFNQEKTALQKQLKKIISDYDNVVSDNSILRKDRKKMLFLRDSIENMNEDSYNLFIKFRKRLNFLEEQNKELSEEIKVLNYENQLLKNKKNIALKYLNLYKKKGSKLSKNNSSLTKSNQVLKAQLKQAKKIKVVNFKIFPMKQKSSGKYTTTSYPKNTSALKLIMLLKKNNFATSGKRQVFVQLVDKNNKTINSKGVLNLSNGSKISYSNELNVEYYKDGVNATSLILIPKGSLEDGNFINIYLEGHLVARKRIQF